MTVQKVKKPKKLKIGSLVYVKTHTAFNNFIGYNRTTPWISNPPINPYPYTQPIGSPWIVNTPSIQPYVGGGTTTSPGITIDIDEEDFDYRKNITWTSETTSLQDAYDYVDIISTNNFSEEEANSLRELYKSYVNQSSGNGGPEGSLGMATWNGPPGGNNNGTWTIGPNTGISIGSRGTITTTGGTGGTTTISAGASGATINIPNTLAVEYAAKGYKRIEDYFVQQPHMVTQEEPFTEDEADMINSTGAFQWGKPFKGIIVDVFSPKLKTQTGEEVELGVNKMPTMYKVLIGEKDCLWFVAEDVYEMVQED